MLIREEPLVSVVTATRNRAALLQRALLSIKAQEFPHYEVIVIDDGSDAITLDAYTDLWCNLDDRFVLELPVAPGAFGTGPAAARNRGIAKARGEFVAFLDDDDEWLLRDHLAVGVCALEETNADCYFTNMRAQRAGTVIWSEWYPNSPQLTTGPQVKECPCVFEVPLRNLMQVMQHHIIHPNNVIVRRKLLKRIGGFLNRLSYGEDYNLTMRVADAAGRILYRPDVAVSYTFQESNSVSFTYSRIEACLQMIFSAQHIRSSCSHREVRRSARSQEAWNLRSLADEVERMGLPVEALAYRWQALCTYPTLGATWGALAGCQRLIGSWFRPRRPSILLPPSGSLGFNRKLRSPERGFDA